MTLPAKNFAKPISEFVTLLSQKGYRGHFLKAEPSGRGEKRQALSDCLNEYLQRYKADASEQELSLETQPPYEPEIRCLFKIRFDQQQGFFIREMEIIHSAHDNSKHYRIDANQQIPGSQTLAGLFPRPKPWDHQLKRKFRM